MFIARPPVVEWTDHPADLNGLVSFAERRNLVSARVPSHFKRSLLFLLFITHKCNWERNLLRYSLSWLLIKYSGSSKTNIYVISNNSFIKSEHVSKPNSGKSGLHCVSNTRTYPVRLGHFILICVKCPILKITAALVESDKSTSTLKFAQLDNSFIYW